MILPRFVRKLLAVFRGSVAPPLIFLSVTLGFWTGLMPGWSGLHTLLAVVVLVLNVHLALFLLSLGIGKAVSLAAAPVLYHVGAWIQAHLSGLLAALASVPVVGLTDFSRFALVGALVLGPIVGAIGGLAMALVVIRFRRMMLKLDGRSEKFHTYYSKLWVRVLDRLLIGRRAKDVKAMFAKPKYVRKIGVALAVLLVAGFLAAARFLQDTAVKDYATKTLTKANKAEVNIENVGISVLGGSVSVAGLQFTDPQKPQNNQLAIETIAADANIRDLLLGRLVMEKVEVSNVRFDQARQTPGVVVHRPDRKETRDPCDYRIGSEDLAKLEKYVKDAKKLKEQLEKLRNWLPEANEPPVEPEQIPHKYLEYLRVRAQVPPAPRVLAKEVLADKVLIPSELFKNSRITLTNVSEAPKAAAVPVTLEIKSYETPALLKATVDFSKDGPPEVSGTFEGFDLGTLQSRLSPGAGMAFQSGLASGTFTGQLTKELVDLTIRVNIKDLKATGQGDGVFGIGGKETSEIMETLNELGAAIHVIGPVTAPRVVFDVNALPDRLTNAVTARLEKEKERAKEQIKSKVQEQIDSKVPEELKKPAKDLLDGLGGLLGPKKKQEKQP